MRALTRALAATAGLTPVPRTQLFFFIASIPFTSSLSREAASVLMSCFTGMVLLVQIPNLKRCFPPFNGEHVRWKYFVPLSFYFFEVAQAMCFLGTDVTMLEFCAWRIARLGARAES